ncbi:hypothetical protein EH165_04925 [Nakamurella antarctica]|uniref:DUF2231 domain-containing protein n=1 Tax=Nakamurella antarctica TaxID=1902245 RepID=A0A3G8ZSW9_9ACTN|nr:DUF2231 domain-containing protein [Nakamurella antarctica]AZI57594.1 hypothetical protein EH165_04925 [Nakamurella antarctica]
MFDTIFGLPVHPLVVHAAVVFLPLAAVSVVLASLWPRFRKWAGWGPLAIATLGVVFTYVAKESGETLQSRLGINVGKHAELGDSMLWWALGLLVAAVAVYYLNRQRKSSNLVPKWLPITAIILSLVGGIGTVVHVVRTGDSGAEAVWGSTTN